eukprot:gene14522-20553_t
MWGGVGGDAGDEPRTDLEAISQKLDELGADNVACVVTTTSCFAPRSSDDIVGVAKLCARTGVAHIINNAYGVQSAALCKEITSAWRKGRVDAVVQSTDKNFMVPVGGAVVAAGKSRPDLVAAVNQTYPGRAAVAAHLDVLITLLHWGAKGWRQELKQREELYPYLKDKLQHLAASLGERVLETPGNPISLGFTLSSLSASHSVAAPAAPGGDDQGAGLAQGSDIPDAASALVSSGPEGSDVNASAGAQAADSAAELASARGASAGASGVSGASAESGSKNPAPLLETFLGSMLWARSISGTRVIAPGKAQTVAGIRFESYGSHHNNYPSVYLTAAAAIGTTFDEVDEFVARLGKVYQEFGKKARSKSKAP